MRNRTERLVTSYWHVCHHCDGVGCEVCEEAGGWFETAEERAERRTSWEAAAAALEHAAPPAPLDPPASSA